MTQRTFHTKGDLHVAGVFRRIKAVAAIALGAFVCVALISCAAQHSVRPPAAAAVAFQPDLTEEQLRQLQLAREVLLSQSADISDETRRNAASLLIDLGAPESRAVIEQALASTHGATVLAALSAMLERGPDELLLDATIGALATAPPEAADAIAAVLADHGDVGNERVAAIAHDKDAPIENRVRAIHAMCAFRSKGGLSRLMTLLEPDRQEPEEILAATCASAETLTGMRLGNNPQRWRAWWNEFRDKPFAEVLRLTVRRLSDQLAATEIKNARLSELYAEALRDIYLLLPKEEQLNRLVKDLGHEMPAVRQLALDRVDRLLRDQERLPDAVKHAMAERLNDTEPSLRKLAARMLDETNFDQLGELLAGALERETDLAAAQEYLRILVKRPWAGAAAPAMRWLSEPGASGAAASLLAQLAQRKELTEEVIEQAREIVRKTVTPNGGTDAPAATPLPAHARLLAIIGKERDLVQLDTMLTTATPEIRQAVADGYLASGRRAPLLANASDASVYPYALRATTNGQADVETLKHVITLTPPEQHQELWLTEVRSVAGKCSPEQALAVDDELIHVKGMDARTRAQLLQRAVDLPAGQLAAADRRTVVLRSAELLDAMNEPGRALAQLDSLAAQNTDEPVQALRLRSAVLANLFDRAQEIEPDAQKWIALLAKLVEEKSEAAFALKREIETRFSENFDEPTRAEFDAVSSLMNSTLGPGKDAVEPEASVDASTTDEPVSP